MTPPRWPCASNHALPTGHRERLLRAGREAGFPQGRRLFEEGGHADRFWIIRNGTVALDMHVPGRRLADHRDARRRRPRRLVLAVRAVRLAARRGGRDPLAGLRVRRRRRASDVPRRPRVRAFRRTLGGPGAGPPAAARPAPGWSTCTGSTRRRTSDDGRAGPPSRGRPSSGDRGHDHASVRTGRRRALPTSCRDSSRWCTPSASARSPVSVSSVRPRARSRAHDARGGRGRRRTVHGPARCVLGVRGPVRPSWDLQPPAAPTWWSSAGGIGLAPLRPVVLRRRSPAGPLRQRHRADRGPHPGRPDHPQGARQLAAAGLDVS